LQICRSGPNYAEVCMIMTYRMYSVIGSRWYRLFE